jgi:hypothetical protein
MGVNFDLLPLPLNFPQSFLPDRNLLARLLPFASASGSGDKLHIGTATGIPTGKSSGKVEPMIHYARGMGLIHAEYCKGQWQLKLTSLGHVITREDPYLSETITLWLLHLLLCRRSTPTEPATGVADAWFSLFAEGSLRLGNRFEQASFLSYLKERHGTKGYLRSLSGLVLRSYLEPVCFGPINAMSVETLDGKTQYLRKVAPTESSYFPAYSAYLFIVWDTLFPDYNQIAIDDLFLKSRYLSILNWDRMKMTRWLDWMADQGLLQLDRQTGNTLALRLCDTEMVIAGIFNELV